MAIDCLRYLNKEQQAELINTLTRCNHKLWSPAATRTPTLRCTPGIYEHLPGPSPAFYFLPLPLFLGVARRPINRDGAIFRYESRCRFSHISNLIKTFLLKMSIWIEGILVFVRAIKIAAARNYISNASICYLIWFFIPGTTIRRIHFNGLMTLRMLRADNKIFVGCTYKEIKLRRMIKAGIVHH